MATHYMSYDDLVRTEQDTANAFAAAYPGTVGLMPELLDTLFQLAYFVEHKEPAAEDGVAFFVFERWVRLPYTLRAIWMLMSAGHYPEAVVIVRHLLEALVQMRYFVAHPSALRAHLDRTGHVPFRAMFEEFAPSYYDRYYGRVLSSIAHAGAGLSVFSEVEQNEGGGAKLVLQLGCKFDDRFATMVLNLTLMLMYGYLKCFPLFSPGSEQLMDADTKERRVGAIAALERWKADHKGKFPKSREWHEQSDLLMGAALPA